MSQFANYYRCPCGEEWEGQWDCGCNDRCPSCNKEIEPYFSDDITDGESASSEEIESARMRAIRNQTGILEVPEMLVSLDGGITWIPALSGVRVLYRGLELTPERSCEIELNHTTEGVITDITSNEENIGTECVETSDIVARLAEIPE